MKNYIGIDIGGTAIKIGLIGADGTIVMEQEFPVSGDIKTIRLIDVVISSSYAFKTYCKNMNYEVSGVGVSATGQIDGKNGVVIGTGGNILGWDQVNLKQTLEPIFNLPIIVENDVNCAAIGEHWIGSGKAFKDLFVYTIGTGIGGAIIINNLLYTGANGIAGEFGHMSIHHEGLLCSCGGSGCFEQYGSMTALIKRASHVIQQPITDGRHLFELLKTNHGEMLTPVIESFIHYHCVAITNVVHLLNPQAVLIGGGVSVQDEMLIQPMIKAVQKKAMPNFTQNLIITPTQLGNRAGMIGAVKNLLNYLDQNKEVQK